MNELTFPQQQQSRVNSVFLHQAICGKNAAYRPGRARPGPAPHSATLIIHPALRGARGGGEGKRGTAGAYAGRARGVSRLITPPPRGRAARSRPGRCPRAANRRGGPAAAPPTGCEREQPIGERAAGGLYRRGGRGRRAAVGERRHHGGGEAGG